MSYARRIARWPLVGSLVVFAYRFTVAGRVWTRSTWALLRWLVTSRESSNFTYELTALNQEYLVAFVSDITRTPREAIAAYVAELTQDNPLKAHVAAMTRKMSSARVAESDVHFGRRLGWYAIARALKPSVIVETGVDKGLGSCVLTSALMRNAAEGSSGRYYGIDINPSAGYLLTGPYREHGEILCGDSLEALERFESQIDLFINDSDHSEDHERAEYKSVASRLSSHAIVLGDNAHATNALLSFAQSTGRRFRFFREEPKGHWYPGAGIGAAFK